MKTNVEKIYKIAQMLYDNPEFLTPGDENKHLRRFYVVEYLSKGTIDSNSLSEKRGLFQTTRINGNSVDCDFVDNCGRIEIYLNGYFESYMYGKLVVEDSLYICNKYVKMFNLNMDFIKSLEQYKIYARDIVVLNKNSKYRK